MQEIYDLIDYIGRSATAFQAVEQGKKKLAGKGFEVLSESDAWHLRPGGRYLVTRNQSSLIAFVMPSSGLDHVQVVASHSDSPMFKVKDHAELEVKDHYVRLDVEGYGGMIMSSWFDRPLSVAGRIAVKTDSGIRTCLVDLERDAAMIPNVAIHMNREINEGYAYKANVDLMPLWGDGTSAGSFRRAVAQCAGVEEEKILGTDLYVYNRMPGTVWGEGEAFFSAPRIDNLECAYASLEAVEGAAPEHFAAVAAIFDNEEVGSTTRQGAASTFLMDVIRRIQLACGLSEEESLSSLQKSMMLSADNAHATHPNHGEYADAANEVFMNEGIVIKHSARQKYTTDAVSEAVFRAVCEKAEVPVQSFANRSDKPGGSTLGNISGTQVSIATVDIGLAQLAMHSSYETAGTKDLAYMIRAMKTFFGTDIRMTEDGVFELRP